MDPVSLATMGCMVGGCCVLMYSRTAWLFSPAASDDVEKQTYHVVVVAATEEHSERDEHPIAAEFDRRYNQMRTTHKTVIVQPPDTGSGSTYRELFRLNWFRASPATKKSMSRVHNR